MRYDCEDIEKGQYRKNIDLMEQMSGNDLTFFVSKVLKEINFEKCSALVLDMVV